MFGVVLWSDVQDQKAVIWCEDHGDLAYYRKPKFGRAIDLDAGDWVQFDLSLDEHLRLAHNPKLVSEGLCPDIAIQLETTTPPGERAKEPRMSGKVIPLSEFRSPPKTVGHRPRQTVNARS